MLRGIISQTIHRKKPIVFNWDIKINEANHTMCLDNIIYKYVCISSWPSYHLIYNYQEYPLQRLKKPSKNILSTNVAYEFGDNKKQTDVTSTKPMKLNDMVNLRKEHPICVQNSQSVSLHHSKKQSVIRVCILLTNMLEAVM